MLIQATALLAILTPIAPADEIPAGFVLTDLPNPSVPAPEVLTLSDGRLVTNNGQTVRLFAADGQFITDLASFMPIGGPGALAVDPTGQYVVAGEKFGGDLLRIDLTTLDVEQIAELPFNEDAVFETKNRLIVTAGACTGNCGSALVRINVLTGEIVTLANVDGPAGHVEQADDGDVLYATATDSLNSTEAVYRFESGQIFNQAPVFHEKGGFLAVEIESVPTLNDWVAETEDDGFTGSTYYRWNGPNFFNTPGVAPLVYNIEIETPGTYTFVIHNKHDDPESDKENDVWVQMDNEQWNKAFSNGGPSNIGVWNWLTWFDYTGPQPNEQAFYNLSAGSHQLRIAARSFNFKIDRFHLYQSNITDFWDVDEPESGRGLDLSDATLVQGGLVDIADLAVTADGRILVADHEIPSDRGRIQIIGEGGAPELLMRTDQFKRVDDMNFVNTPGPGLFYPYQSTGGGELFYQKSLGTVRSRSSFEPRRPFLSLAGPGATPSGGELDFNITVAPEGSIGLLLAAPSATSVGTEVPIPGLPLIFSKLDLANTLILPGTLPPVGSDGKTSATFLNPNGSNVPISFQALFFNLLTGEFDAATNAPAL